MLPSLHDGWFRAVTGAPAPEERRATCARCAMAQHPGDPPPLTHTFSNDLKCCTYTPRLANFIVGRILADTADDELTTAGRSSVIERVERLVDASPLALEAPLAYGLLYEHGAQAGFGVAPSLLCPHFHSPTGQCGIWRHRESVCATYHCKYERGAVGHRMWTAAKEWFHAVEETLAWHALLELGLGDEKAMAHLLAQSELDARPLDAASLGAPVDERELQARWGTWAGRQKDYYLATWDIVRDLGPDDVFRLGGVRLAARAHALEIAWREFTSRAVPKRLHHRALTVLRSDGDHCVVGTCSGIDAMALPRALVAALPRFDGRPTTAVVEEIRNEDRLELTSSLLRALADFEVLEPGG
jgi:Fe-S-cluster containining protein